MTTFIKQQQELAREQYGKADYEWNDLDTLITQIITNTGEELMRLAEGEKYVTSAEEHERRRDHATKGGYEKAIDTIKQHINNLTGVE